MLCRVREHVIFKLGSNMAENLTKKRRDRHLTGNMDNGDCTPSLFEKHSRKTNRSFLMERNSVNKDGDDSPRCGEELSRWSEKVYIIK